jgi:hypothetical protein
MKGTRKKHNATFKARGDQGRSTLPIGCASCASPASRANSKSGEMPAFAAHIPTDAAANKGFDIDKVKGRRVTSAVALTTIGADIETSWATPQQASPTVRRSGPTSGRCWLGTGTIFRISGENPQLVWGCPLVSPHVRQKAMIGHRCYVEQPDD